MSRRYAAVGEGAAGTDKAIMEVVAATTTRGWIYDILIGTDASPLDLAGQFDIIRGSAAGTGSPTAITPRALDGANPASLLTANAQTWTADPTKTANSSMLMIGLNQRATFRWVAAPGGEIVIPATSAARVLLNSTAHGGTPNINCTMHWEE